MTTTMDDRTIVILDGGRRTPRADILINNREPGLFSRFSTTQLGGFAIAGTLKSLDHGQGAIVAVLLGVLTGVGGGVIRDVLVAEVPVVLRQEIYALAALVGGAVFVEQQLNMAVAESGATTDDITRYLGRVTMFLSMAGLVVQVGLTSRLHRTYGLAASLLLLPIVLGASTVVILATGAVWAAALARVLDTSLRYTVDRTTREVLFLPLPVELTQQAKPFVDVTVDRIAKGIGAVLLLGLIKPWGLGLAWQQLGYVNLIIVAAWIGLALAAHREYLSMFRRNLHTGAIQPAAVRFDIADSRTIALLVSELWSPKDASVVYAIDMLETVGRPDVLPASLFAHQSGSVRARALLALERSDSADTESMLPIVRRLMTDPEADVRAAAQPGAPSVWPAIWNERSEMSLWTK